MFQKINKNVKNLKIRFFIDSHIPSSYLKSLIIYIFKTQIEILIKIFNNFFNQNKNQEKLIERKIWEKLCTVDIETS